jgi:hypothetical protein
LVVLAHFSLILGNIGAFLVLPFAAPWYVSLPIMVVIGQTFTSRTVSCPVTKLENWLRLKLGLKEVHGFIGYYFLRPARRLLGMRRTPRPAQTDELALDSLGPIVQHPLP